MRLLEEASSSFRRSQKTGLLEGLEGRSQKVGFLEGMERSQKVPEGLEGTSVEEDWVTPFGSLAPSSPDRVGEEENEEEESEGVEGMYNEVTMLPDGFETVVPLLLLPQAHDEVRGSSDKIVCVRSGGRGGRLSVHADYYT